MNYRFRFIIKEIKKQGTRPDQSNSSMMQVPLTQRGKNQVCKEAVNNNNIKKINEKACLPLTDSPALFW